MNTEVSVANLADKPVLSNLLQLYLYDFSEFDGSDLKPSGQYRYDYLDSYWGEDGRHPFLVRVNGLMAGLGDVFG